MAIRSSSHGPQTLLHVYKTLLHDSKTLSHYTTMTPGPQLDRLYDSSHDFLAALQNAPSRTTLELALCGYASITV